MLLDVNMPGIDGFETAALIRKRKRSAHTPIIFVTAFPDEVRAARGLRARGRRLSAKPHRPRRFLQAKVNVFVELFRMTEQIKQQGEERFALAQERMRRTAAEEANSRLQFLAEVTAVVGRSLDYATTARDLVRLTVPTLGDRAIVARRDPSGGRWQIVQAAATDGPVAIERAFEPRPVAGRSGRGRVATLTTGTTTVLSERAARSAR